MKMELPNLWMEPVDEIVDGFCVTNWEGHEEKMAGRDMFVPAARIRELIEGWRIINNLTAYRALVEELESLIAEDK